MPRTSNLRLFLNLCLRCHHESYVVEPNVAQTMKKINNFLKKCHFEMQIWLNMTVTGTVFIL